MLLKKDCLSRKFLELVWGEHVEYATNLCSHFWAVVIAVLMVTALLPIYLAGRACIGVANTYDSYTIYRREKNIERGKKLSVSQAFSLMIKLKLFNGTYPNVRPATNSLPYMGWSCGSKGELLYGWISANDDCEQQLEDYCDYISKTFSRNKPASVAIDVRKTLLTYLPAAVKALIAGTFLIILPWVWFEIYMDSGSAAPATFITLFLAVVLFFIIGFCFLDGHLERVARKYGNYPLEDDVFASYLKAAKKKMCPIIEWVD